MLISEIEKLSTILKFLVTLSFGTLFMVLSGRNTLRTLRDLMVLRFLPAEPLSL